MLHTTRLEGLVNDKQSNLLAQLVSYEFKELLWIQHLVYSQHFIFFVTHESTKKARLLHNTWLEGLAIYKQFNLLLQFVTYKYKAVSWMQHLVYSQNFIFFQTYKKSYSVT